MIAIFIAAGMGSRLTPLTNDCPKCMLPLAGQPILRRNIDVLRKHGVKKIYVITGYKREKIDFSDIEIIVNTDYQNNNILFSLMYAEDIFQKAIEQQEDLVISYSDIVYEPIVVAKLMQTKKDFALVADQDWQTAYVGRTEHPESEAEKMIVYKNTIIKIGKGVTADIDKPSQLESEFIGLFKLSPKACQIWLDEFQELQTTLRATMPFMGALEFQKSYLSHFFQYLINKGIDISPSFINGGWREFDTKQDYDALKEMYEP